MRTGIKKTFLMTLTLFCIGGVALGAVSLYMQQPASGSVTQTDFHKALILETKSVKPNEALNAYRKFLEDFPNSEECSRAQFRIGVCLKKLGRYEDAKREFELTLKRYPENPEILNRARQEIEAISKLVLSQEHRDRLEALADEAESADSTRKINIARELARMKILEVLPILYRMMEDKDEKIRIEALAGISSVSSRSSLPVLRKYADDPTSPKFRFEVRRAIQNLELLTPAEMMSLLYSTDPKQRELAKKSLPEYKKSPLVDMLIKRIAETEQKIEERAITLVYLGFTGDRRKRSVCEEYMKKDKPELVRMGAAYAVALLGDRKSAIAVLRNALRHEDALVKSLAANYLALLAVGDGCPLLISDLESQNPSARKKAAESLRRFSGKTFDYDPLETPEKRQKAVAAWKEWWEKVKEKNENNNRQEKR